MPKTVIKDIKQVGSRYGCTECPKVCKSLAGLSKHMNAMHLVLSPNQIKQSETA